MWGAVPALRPTEGSDNELPQTRFYGCKAAPGQGTPLGEKPPSHRRAMKLDSVDMTGAQAGAPTHRLVAAEVEALVAIRALMEESLRRTTDPSVLGRHVSVVLLDGVCEAVVALGLAKFNDGPSEKDTLNTLYSRLLNHLRTTHPLPGGISGWPDVRRLRRLRNDAQHHQIPPDHQTLVRWSASVQRFVQAVVELTFDTELALVTLAQSIADPELRAAFARAEERAVSGEPVEAVSALSDAFNKARLKWADEHRDATRFSRPHLDRDDLGIRAAIDRATEPLEDMLSVAPFVLDLGEYVWWQGLADSVRIDASVPVSHEDARRALVFVLTWIQRWEAFSATYMRDRLGKRQRQVPPPSDLPDGTPKLLRRCKYRFLVHRDRRPNQQPELRLMMTLMYAAGQHGDDSGLEWDQYMNEALAAHTQQKGCPWESARAWAGELTVQVAPDQDPNAVSAALHEAMKDAAARRQTSHARRTEDQAYIQDTFPAIEKCLSQILTDSGEPAFARIELQRLRSSSGSETTDSVMARFTDSLADAARDRLQRDAPSGDLTSWTGRLHGIGYEVPLSTPLEVVKLEARQAVDLVTARRHLMDDEIERVNRQRNEAEARYRAVFGDDGSY